MVLEMMVDTAGAWQSEMEMVEICTNWDFHWQQCTRLSSCVAFSVSWFVAVEQMVID